MTWRVDAHQHLWELDVVPQPWLDGPEFIPIRRDFTVVDYVSESGAHVDRSVLVQTVGLEHETPLFLAAAACTERIGGVVGWVDLTAPDVAARLAALRQRVDGQWLVGIRHQVQGEPDPRWLCRDDVRAGLRSVGAAELVYDLLTIPAQLRAAIETAAELDEVTFVVDHLSKPPIASGGLEPWASEIRELARLPNVACKLSGMVTEADWATWTVEDLRPYAEVVLDAFGPERVMFGSDWPVCLLAASYAEVLDATSQLLAGCIEAERAEVMGGTATRWYRLDRGSDGEPS